MWAASEGQTAFQRRKPWASGPLDQRFSKRGPRFTCRRVLESSLKPGNPSPRPDLLTRRLGAGPGNLHRDKLGGVSAAHQNVEAPREEVGTKEPEGKGDVTPTTARAD